MMNFPKKFVLKAIKIYQWTLSPDHSQYGKLRHPHGYCRFYPSCSVYAYQAIEKFGCFHGGFLAIKRILRCNPFHQPAIDRIPESARLKSKEKRVKYRYSLRSSD